MLTVIILTYNEDIHLARCIRSVLPVATKIIVIDSYSSDNTVEIAEQLGAAVYKNTFVNQAVQFQWGLDNIVIQTPWIMRIDADEYLTPKLANEIAGRLPLLEAGVSGVVLKRQVHFMGRWIRYGGYYPTKLLRIWRNGTGRIEQRWMDEHIKLSEGRTVEFEHDFVDDNLNNLTWWTNKHNNYSTREAVDLLNREFDLFEEDTILGSGGGNGQDKRKRWYKDNIYVKMPLFLRAFAYFLFRYFLKLGFLDGKAGLIWHLLQGGWYRFLVDAKIYQIKRLAKQQNKSIREILTDNFDIRL